MADKPRRVVYSTDPAPDEVTRPAAASPPDLAAPLPTRQRGMPVRVRRDRKGRGGKTVSVIEGVMSPPAGKEALLKHLKTRLGAGGTVKGDLIEIQGDHREKIVALLVELGYQAKVAGG